MDEKDLYWVWLISLDGIGHVAQEKLINYFKKPKSIWEADEAALRDSKLFEKDEDIYTILNRKYRDNAYSNLETLSQLNAYVVDCFDQRYPEALRNYHGHPMVIFVRGKIRRNEFRLAVIGTRKASDYGKKAAVVFTETLAKNKITIVSGMAEGIDTCAHKATLKVEGNTIAVLGSGFNRIFPVINTKLSDEIVEKGALITEYLPYTCAAKHTFPERNKIVSGLSEGVLVIESGESGGALITANIAHDQNRDIFAVPGNIFSVKSVGTNNLIKDTAAIPVTEPGDILQYYKDKGAFKYIDLDKRKIVFETEKYNACNDNQKSIINLLYVKDLHIDEIIDITGFERAAVNHDLLMLEIKEMIGLLPGGKYTLY